MEKVKAGETGAGKNLKSRTGVDRRLRRRRNRRHPRVMARSNDRRPTRHLNNQVIRNRTRREAHLTERRPSGGQVGALFESRSSQTSFFASPALPFVQAQWQSGHKMGGASLSLEQLQPSALITVTLISFTRRDSSFLDGSTG